MKDHINNIYHSRRWNWMIVASAASAALVGGSLAWAESQGGKSQDGSAVIQRIEDAPTPYLRNQFVGMDGKFFVLPWDDRNLTEEAKRADPVFNPAWVPFSQCLATRGVEVRTDASAKFGQADLDRLLERVNRENPDTKANLQIPRKAVDRLQGTAGAFLDCAEQWLTKSPQEIEALTGVVEPVPTSLTR